jgi:PST family polysaccharide transporter
MSEQLGADAAKRERRQLDRFLIQGLAWTAAAKWISQIFSWAATIAVARLLVPEDYGIVAMAGVFCGLVGVLNEFGLGAAVVAIRQLTQDEIARIHSLACAFGGGAFVLSAIVALPAGWVFGLQEVPLVVVALGAGFVIAALRSVPSALLEKELRFRFLALQEGFQSIVSVLVTLSLAWWGCRYWSLVAGGLAGNVVASVIVLAAKPVPLAWPVVNSIEHVMRFSLHVLVNRVCWYAASSSDLFLAGRLLGQGAAGSYAYASNLATIPLDKVTALASRVMPGFFSSVQTDTNAVRRYLLLVTEGVSLVTFPVGVGMTLVADDLVWFVLGKKWEGVIGPLQILASWSVVRSVSGLVVPILYVTGGSRVAMVSGLLSMALFPIAFWIGSAWGALGLAITWLFVGPLSLVLPYWHVFRAIQLTAGPYLRSMSHAICGVVLMSTAVCVIRLSVPDECSLPVRLMAEVTTGAAVYLLLAATVYRQRIGQLIAHFQTAS